ncbi:MAG TPA: type VI secretion system baseplate subunit TssG, partial [Isosphaeraceae bacterium]
MATAGRRADPPLELVLFEEAYRFDFFQAVRLLERLQPGGVPVGGKPGREVVRIRTRPSLSFPASAIHQLNRPEGAEGRAIMAVAFMGLTGPLGVLPVCYTELVMDRLRAGDRALAAFLDLFHHRLVSFFYRAWEKYRPAIAYERSRARPPEADGAANGRAATTAPPDAFSDYLFHLIGLGTRPLRGRHTFADAGLLAYAGLFAQRHRPAVVLEALLRGYFGLTIEVHQFVGQWLRLDPGDRSTIGASGAHNALGRGALLGERVWDEQGKFRLRVGPLSFAQFQEHQPDRPLFRALAEMARLFVDAEFAFDVQLVLKAAEVPSSRLSSGPDGGTRLGR